MFAKYDVVACAMTKNAARSRDGITFHKLFRAKENWEWTPEGLWRSIESNTITWKVLCNVKVLILDEISTVKRNVLEAVVAVLRRIFDTCGRGYLEPQSVQP